MTHTLTFSQCMIGNFESVDVACFSFMYLTRFIWCNYQIFIGWIPFIAFDFSCPGTVLRWLIVSLSVLGSCSLLHPCFPNYYRTKCPLVCLLFLTCPLAVSSERRPAAHHPTLTSDCPAALHQSLASVRCLIINVLFLYHCSTFSSLPFLKSFCFVFLLSCSSFLCLLGSHLHFKRPLPTGRLNFVLAETAFNNARLFHCPEASKSSFGSNYLLSVDLKYGHVSQNNL